MNPRRRRNNRRARKSRRTLDTRWHRHVGEDGVGYDYRYVPGPAYLAGYGDAIHLRLDPDPLPPWGVK